MNEETKNRIIEMAWEDRTPFDAIKDQFGMSEKDVITIMRRNLRLSSFKLWRKRVSGRKTKHRINHGKNTHRFKSKNQISTQGRRPLPCELQHDTRRD